MRLPSLREVCLKTLDFWTPGFDAEYPAKDVGDYYKEFMAIERGGGFDPADIYHVRLYHEENEQIVEPDLEKLDKSRPQTKRNSQIDRGAPSGNDRKVSSGNQSNDGLAKPNGSPTSSRSAGQALVIITKNTWFKPKKKTLDQLDSQTLTRIVWGQSFLWNEALTPGIRNIKPNSPNYTPTNVKAMLRHDHWEPSTLKRTWTMSGSGRGCRFRRWEFPRRWRWGPFAHWLDWQNWKASWLREKSRAKQFTKFEHSTSYSLELEYDHNLNSSRSLTRRMLYYSRSSSIILTSIPERCIWRSINDFRMSQLVSEI